MDSEDRVVCKNCIATHDCVVENKVHCANKILILSLPALSPVTTTSRICHVYCSRREPVFLLFPTLLVHSTPAFASSSQLFVVV